MTRRPRIRRTPPPLPQEYVERVDRAWDALEEGRLEIAGLAAEELLDETDEHPEVRFLFGAALLESGNHGEALEQLLDCEGLVEDPIVHKFYLASGLHENLRTEEAEKLFREVILEEREAAPPHYGLAQSLEFLGNWDEAEREYEEAHRMEAAAFPLPTRMKPAAFEKVVAEAVRYLPDELQGHVAQVAIVVEPMPTREILLSESGEETITPGVLGLFVGPSLKDRSSFDPVTVPPTIFLYQRNLERFCQTKEELIYEIKLTLYHELGHYLGLTEDELEERGLD